MIMNNPHIDDETCWCKPICIFNAGKRYGRVFIHADKEDNLKHDPGASALIKAVKIAIQDKDEVHISDYPHMFKKGQQN